MRPIALVLLTACGRIGFDFDFDATAMDDASSSIADVPISTVDGATLACGARMATGVAESGAISGNFGSLTEDAAGTCGGTGVGDQLYAIDIPTGGALLAAADLGSFNNSIVHIRSTCDQPATELVCASDGGRGGNGAFRTNVVPAGRYWVFVDNDTVGSDTYLGTISALLPLGAACSLANARDRCGPDLECVNGTCVAPTCGDALAPQAPPIDVTVMTSGAPNRHAGELACSEGNDSGVRAGERVVRVTLSSPVANLNVTTNHAETTYDTILYVRDACLGAQIGCNDDDTSGSGGGQSTVDTGPLAAGTYYIFVDGFGGRSGTARLTVTASAT